MLTIPRYAADKQLRDKKAIGSGQRGMFDSDASVWSRPTLAAPSHVARVVKQGW